MSLPLGAEVSIKSKHSRWHEKTGRIEYVDRGFTLPGAKETHPVFYLVKMDDQKFLATMDLSHNPSVTEKGCVWFREKEVVPVLRMRRKSRPTPHRPERNSSDKSQDGENQHVPDARVQGSGSEG